MLCARLLQSFRCGAARRLTLGEKSPRTSAASGEGVGLRLLGTEAESDKKNPEGEDGEQNASRGAAPMFEHSRGASECWARETTQRQAHTFCLPLARIPGITP